MSLSAHVMNPHIPSTMKSLTCKLKLGPRCKVNPLSTAPQGVSGLIGEVSVPCLEPAGVTAPQSSLAFIYRPFKRKSLRMFGLISTGNPLFPSGLILLMTVCLWEERINVPD